MDIRTKFGIGAKVWIIRNCKAVEIEVNNIAVSAKGISYGEDPYRLFPEAECFPSKEALIDYLTR